MAPLSCQRPVHQGSGSPIPSALRQQPYLPLPAMRPLSPSGCLPQSLRAPLGRRTPKAWCCPSYGAPHTAPGTNAGHGGAAGLGLAQAPTPCRLAAQATQPGCRAMAVIRRLFHRAQADLFSASVPPKKKTKGPVSRRRPAPSQKRAQHGQPMPPSAAGGTRAKRRRTTGPRRRTWAWRTGCCPHGRGCRRDREAGCWSPSHAPRA